MQNPPGLTVRHEERTDDDPAERGVGQPLLGACLGPYDDRPDGDRPLCRDAHTTQRGSECECARAVGSDSDWR